MAAAVAAVIPRLRRPPRRRDKLALYDGGFLLFFACTAGSTYIVPCTLAYRIAGTISYRTTDVGTCRKHRIVEEKRTANQDIPASVVALCFTRS